MFVLKDLDGVQPIERRGYKFNNSGRNIANQKDWNARDFPTSYFYDKSLFRSFVFPYDLSRGEVQRIYGSHSLKHSSGSGREWEFDLDGLS